MPDARALNNRQSSYPDTAPYHSHPFPLTAPEHPQAQAQAQAPGPAAARVKALRKP